MSTLSKQLIFSALLVAASIPVHGQLYFSGTDVSPVKITPESSTGLEAIYVIRDTHNVRIGFQGDPSLAWSVFGAAGGGYASASGTSPIFNIATSDDFGLIAEVGGRQHCYWIVNYANHPFSVNSFEIGNSDCMTAVIDFNGAAEPIHYYSINGRQLQLDRNIDISYSTLIYDQDSQRFMVKEEVQSFQHLTPSIRLNAPLCETAFTLSGDKFLSAWGEPATAETARVQPKAIAIETTASQAVRDNDNEQNVPGVALGGSAPCDIHFEAAVSDAALFYEWQLSDNPEFDPIDDRYRETVLDHTFHSYGTIYARFYAAGADAACESFSPVYEITVGESQLLCPNAFSPQASPGVNDEWKVSYKSIVSFECHIFNRWGTEMTSFSDPAAGWDGKYKGKFVPAGVYYYVIKATGADGRRYNLSGDINIIDARSSFKTNPDAY